MRIEYEVSVDDLVAFNLFHTKHSRTVKRTTFIGGVVFPAGIFLLSCLNGWYARDWGAPVIGALCGGGLAYFIFGTRRWRVTRAVRKMLSEGSNKGHLGPHQLELTDTELVERTESAESKFRWDGIERVGFTPDYTFIYTGAVTALVVPRASVTEGNYDQLAQALKQKLEAKTQVLEQSDDSYKPVVTDKEKFYRPDRNIGKHSGLGIASFVIAIVVTVLILSGLVVFVALLATDSDPEQDSPALLGVFTFCLIFGFFAGLVGLCLGIAGANDKNRKSVFGILGIIFNALILLGFIALILIGMFLA